MISDTSPLRATRCLGDSRLRRRLRCVGNSNATEHVLFGVNHSGNATNRIRQVSGATTDALGSDGIWFSLEGAAGLLRDYTAYTSTNRGTLPHLITNRTATAVAPGKSISASGTSMFVLSIPAGVIAS